MCMRSTAAASSASNVAEGGVHGHEPTLCAQWEAYFTFGWTNERRVACDATSVTQGAYSDGLGADHTELLSDDPCQVYTAVFEYVIGTFATPVEAAWAYDRFVLSQDLNPVVVNFHPVPPPDSPHAKLTLNARSRPDEGLVVTL